MSETSTLLIVDDCEIDREVFREYLSEDSQASYEIFEAEEAAEGLALCQEIQCDLILLDFRLPDMTGLEFLQQRQQQKGPLPSVIMMTGEGCETIAVQAMRYGAENYLSKDDLQATVLIQAVQDAIRQRRLNAPQINPLPEAMAASVLRFRRSLELQTIAEAAVAEILRLARCDRVSLVQGAQILNPTPLAKAQSLQLNHQLRMEATAQQRRRRGRPPKNKVSIPPLREQKLPVKRAGDSQPWGWVQLEYLPEAPMLEESEQSAFAALMEQLATAIHQAEDYQAATERIFELEAGASHALNVTSQDLVTARTLLSNLLTTVSTMTKHHTQLSQQRQMSLLRQVEEYSREFVKLLEQLVNS